MKHSKMASFPYSRPRRLRLNPNLRRLVRETILSPDDLIYPLFVRYGQDEKRPIASMPNQFQFTVDKLADEARSIAELGIPAVILFGIPEHKDWCGTDNFSENGIIPQAIRTIKDAVPDLVVISDMCFCEYTTHGHCGIINTPDNEHYQPHLPDGYLLNDQTLVLLAQASAIHASAGADIIAPSGMVDGMVRAIRESLDTEGHQLVSIMSYAAKYTSGFYGPFRDAAESPPSFGDRSQYQMDGANRSEAIKEVALDVAEGADFLMVKPALAYLDIIREVKDTFNLPLSAYQVSGEFSMIHAASERGWLDLPTVALETLTSIKRAGSDMIVSYFAKDVATWLNQ